MASSITLRERAFFGLNVATTPEALPEGWLTEATNALIVGSVNGSGGYVQTRPGKRAQLSSPASGGFTAATTLVDNTGTTWLVAAVGGTSGSVVRWKPGQTTVTPLSNLGTVDATKVQFAVLGEYLFVCDGGNLRRVKNDWTGDGSATGLPKPGYTPAAKLVNSTLLSLAGCGADTTIPYPPIFSPLYNASHNHGWDGWTAQNLNGDDLEMTRPTDGEFENDWYLRMDNAGPSLLSDPVVNPDKGNTVGAHGVGMTVRRPVHVLFSCRYKADTKDDSIRIRVTAYSDTDGDDLIAEQEYLLTSELYGIGLEHLPQRRSQLFSFAGIGGDTTIRSWRVQILPGLLPRPGTNGPYISHVYLTPVVPGLDIHNTGSGATVAVRQPTDPESNKPENTDTAFWGWNRLTGDLGSSKDWSKYQQIALPCTLLDGMAKPRVKLGIRSTPNALTHYSVVGDMVEIAGRNYLTWDLSTMDPADLTSVRIVELVFVGDTTLPPGVQNTGQPLLTLGNLLYAGNLTVGGATYEYRLTEDSGGTDPLVSPASAISASLQTTAVQAQSDIFGLSSVPTDRRITFWRRGGAFSDGLFRKLAVLPHPDADASDTDGYWQWQVGNKQFHDNVPDSQLLLADTLLDHEPVPPRVVAIAAWNDRLALAISADATSSTTGLYVSQLETGAATGMYYNGRQVPNIPDSPTAATEGFYAPLTSIQTAGKVVRMVPFLGRLVLLFPTTRLVMTATDATDFKLETWNADAGKGAVARNAIAIVGGRILFLAPDGLRAFDLYSDSSSNRGGDSLLTEAIRPVLSPTGFDFTEAALASGEYSQSAVWTHAGRLFLAIPTNGGTGTVYVLDDSTSAWVRWDVGMIRAGVEINGELYVLDASGQISLFGNAFGDTTVLGGTIDPVMLTTTTRGLSAGAGQISAFALRMVAENSGEANAVATLRVLPEAEETIVSFPYILEPGQTRARFRILGALATGRYVRVKVEATTTTTPVRLREIELDATPLHLTR